MRRFSGRRGTTTPVASSDRAPPSAWSRVGIAVIITVVTMSILQSVPTHDDARWMQDSMLKLQQATSTTPSPGDGRIMTTPTMNKDFDSLDTTRTVAPEYQLAFEQSLGFFNDIPNDLWTSYYQTRARNAEHYRVAKNPNQRMGWTHHWNFFNWDPFFSCPRLDKVGGLGDGPKWTCDIDRVGVQAARRKQADTSPASSPSDKHCLIYSIGSNGDYQWEDAVRETLKDSAGGGCEIHIFDPGNFDRGVNNTINGMVYHKWGLASSYETTANNLVTKRRKRRKSIETHSFPEIQKLLGHEGRTIDILKIDCEGCEWTTYKDWINTDIRQILIETHDLPRVSQPTVTQWGTIPAMRASDYFDAFKQAGFVLFSKEVNSAWGEGKCVEWSYLKLHTDFLGDSIARTSNQ